MSPLDIGFMYVGAETGESKLTRGDVCWFQVQRYLLVDVSSLGARPFFFSLSLFFFKENLQLAVCTELQPKIQAWQALRKENSCQTMNYCSGTRLPKEWTYSIQKCCLSVL